MRIGIIGGTFDPIHEGHTYIAKAVQEICSLDQVLFMVSRHPPHKGPARITNPFHRYAMTALALADEGSLLACGLELRRDGPSYTIDTLDELSVRHRNGNLGFIAGSDSLKEIHLWRDYGNLFKRHSLVFVQRPGFEVSLDHLGVLPEYRQRIRVIGETAPVELVAGTSYLLTVDAPPISSTEIRGRLRKGQSILPGHLHPLVTRYIAKHRLYHDNEERT